MPSAPWMSWMPVVFAAAGLLFIIMGARHLIGDRRHRGHWRPLPGRVVTSRLSDGQFQSQVGYVLDGRDYLFWNRYTSSGMTDPVGRDVEVLVNPDDPTDAVVNTRLSSGLGLGIGLIAVGVIAIVFGLRFR